MTNGTTALKFKQTYLDHTTYELLHCWLKSRGAR